MRIEQHRLDDRMNTLHAVRIFMRKETKKVTTSQTKRKIQKINKNKQKYMQ